MAVSYRYDGTLSKDDQLQLLYEALIGTPDMIASVIDRLNLTITQRAMASANSNLWCPSCHSQQTRIIELETEISQSRDLLCNAIDVDKDCNLLGAARGAISNIKMFEKESIEATREIISLRNQLIMHESTKDSLIKNLKKWINILTRGKTND